jgi:hypothetical protein
LEIVCFLRASEKCEKCIEMIRHSPSTALEQTMPNTLKIL